MEINVNFLNWVLAFVPIVLLLFLMVKVQLPAYKAAPFSLALAIGVGLIVYKAAPLLILKEMVNGVGNSISIILIIFTAILIYEVTYEAKAFGSLRIMLRKIAPNELVRILGLGMVFVSFIQGVTGFGVPVAVTAPLLIEMGLSPVWAVVLPLVGHSWAGTFGTLAAAWLALVSQSGVDGALLNEAGFYAGIFLWIINVWGGMTICWFYGKSKGIKKGFVAVLIISLIQGGGELVLTQINGSIASFLPGCIALIAFLFINKLPMYRDVWCIDDSSIMDRKRQSMEDSFINMKPFEMFFPYIVMTVVTLVILLSPFIPFSHPSIFLFISAISGYLFYAGRGYINKGRWMFISKRAVRKTLPPSIAVVSLVMLSKVMDGTGQIDVLAKGAAMLLGANYAFIAPTVGLLGSFITSSNLSSNILFSRFQLTTAELLSLSPGVLLGAQTGGASLGTAFTPSNIVLGATTANITGEEGKILNKTLPFIIGITIFFGLLTYLFIRIV